MTDTPRPGRTSVAPTAAEQAAAEDLLERLRAATIGEYDIHGELGRGGMATVFLAHEVSLDRKVAIKVMHPTMVHGSGMVERFKREARTAAALSHPNIIPIYSVREVDGLLFCVIKLVQGTPLDAIMKELGQLPVSMVQGILAQVGGALGYAHRHGVVHRDIKPGNILIDDEGWAVVTDFGIAKVMEDSEGLTLTGMAVGTPAYMSPEQAAADAITSASDQYSLGIVAYEMLCGRTPFTGTSTMKLMYSHFHDEPPSIRLLRPDCPDALHDAVMRMLRKAPGERWPSMEDAVAAAGARPLDHDDPTRSQLISLARTGLTHRIVSQAQTPRSPIPATRSHRKGSPTATRRNPFALAGGGVVLLAAGFLLAKLIGGNGSADALSPSAGLPSDPGSAVSTPPAVQEQPERPEQPERREPPERREVPERPGRTLSPTAGAPGSTGPAGPGREAAATSAAAITTAAGQRNVPESTAAQPVAQRAESSAASPPPRPVVNPPPLAAANTAAAAPPNVVSRTPEPPVLVAAVIESYARALAAGDLATARRIYPAMPTEQREGLEALWRDGGRMATAWTVTDIVIDGDVATARVRGSNVVTTRRGTSTVPVALRARLERRDRDWRLVSLVN